MLRPDRQCQTRFCAACAHQAQAHRPGGVAFAAGIADTSTASAAKLPISAGGDTAPGNGGGGGGGGGDDEDDGVLLRLAKDRSTPANRFVAAARRHPQLLTLEEEDTATVSHSPDLLHSSL